MKNLSVRKEYNGGVWTEGRFRGFITSALRGSMRRWPPKWETLRDARVGRKLNKKTGRKALHFRCASCRKEFPQNRVQVDHKIAIGKCLTWDEFIEKLFCEKDNLQVLCKVCHKKKTKKEQK